jgi:signal transduction histidine kinase
MEINAIKKLSIKNKLIILMLSITIFSLSIGFGVIIVNDINNFKKNAISQLQLMGQLVADYSIPDLLFQDHKESKKTLSKLNKIKHLELAIIYNNKNNIFTFHNPKNIKNIPNNIFQNYETFQNHSILTYIPIIDSSSKKLGTLYLQISDTELQTQIKEHLLLMLGCLLVSILFALFLVIEFQRIISAPILYLASIAKDISKNENYNLHIQKHSEDEIGTLYDGFNTMLNQIHQRQQLQQKTELALKKAKELAETASEAKSKFLANISHELRTPLNSLLILAKDLTKNNHNNLESDQTEALTIIHKSGLDLLHLINDLLDLSKIEAGKTELVIEKVAIESIETDMFQQFKPLAQENNLTFNISTNKNLTTAITTDKQKLYQIIRNLLSNAFKFTHTGSIQFNITKASQNHIRSSELNTDNAIAIVVSDTGIGIAENKLEHIFDAFHQADSRNFAGTGLGLSIAKEHAKAIKGNIIVSSKENQGSTFTLIIPDRIQSTEFINHNSYKQKENSFPEYEAAEKYKNSFSNKTIMVVDDDMRTAFAISNICKQMGLEVILAQNGQKALEKLDSSKQNPDLIMTYSPQQATRYLF